MQWAGAHYTGAAVAHSTAPIPMALADAMVKFPEEAEQYKEAVDTRRAIAGLKYVSGW